LVAFKKPKRSSKPSLDEVVPEEQNPAKSLGLLEKVDLLSKTYRSIDDPEFTKSGSVVLDALFGGGIPKGCFILWSSDTGIGKTTGSLYVSKSYCVQGKKVLYLDYEGGVNEPTLKSMGLWEYKYDKDKNPNGTFYVYRVHTFADAEKFLDLLLTEVDLIVIDSVTAMFPSKLADVSVEENQPGVQARMMAGLMLKYKAESMKQGTTWIMINQLRTKIRFVGQTTEEEAGGKALKFYSDYRVLMKEAYGGTLEKTEKTALGEKKVPYGSINDIWCVKSRYSRPFIPLRLAVIFGKGVSNNYAYYDFLESRGCIKKSGSWYEITVNGSTGKAQGTERVVEWINQNKEIVKKFVAEQGGYTLLMQEATEVKVDVPSLPEPQMEDIKEDFDNIVVGNIDEQRV
jgi:protein RecA